MMPSLPFGKRLPVVLLLVAAAGVTFGLLTGDWTLVTIAVLAIAGLIVAFPVAAWVLGRSDEEPGEHPDG